MPSNGLLQVHDGEMCSWMSPKCDSAVLKRRPSRPIEQFEQKGQRRRESGFLCAKTNSEQGGPKNVGETGKKGEYLHLVYHHCRIGHEIGKILHSLP